MDFTTSIPKSKGKNVIMVVVDRITKYAHLGEISHIFYGSTIPVSFMETFQKIHGNPKIIVSERDPIFTGKFLTRLFS